MGVRRGTWDLGLGGPWAPRGATAVRAFVLVLSSGPLGSACDAALTETTEGVERDAARRAPRPRRDASAPDASAPDASAPDASAPDASGPDTGAGDAEPTDASAGLPDAATGPEDASGPDAEAPPPPTGAFYVVDGDDPAADDSNPGTVEAPWRTLARASNVVRPGDTVYVRSARYTETLDIRTSGVTGAPIRFAAYPGERPHIEAGPNVRATRVAHVVVAGFELTGAAFTSVHLDGCSDIAILGNAIHEATSKAIYLANGAARIRIADNDIYHLNDAVSNFNRDLGVRYDDIVIENNRIRDLAGYGGHEDGIEWSGPSRGLVIRNNVIKDTTQNIYLAPDIAGMLVEDVEISGNLIYNDYADGWAKGIFVAPSGGASIAGVRIFGNTLGYHNGPGVLLVDDTSDVVLRNNVFYESGLGIGSSRPDTVRSDYNLFWRVTTGIALSQGGVFAGDLDEYRRAFPDREPHSLGVDPGFIDYTRGRSWDFHLAAESPARLAGDPGLAAVVPLPDPWLDLDGEARPRSSPSNLGAY